MRSILIVLSLLSLSCLCCTGKKSKADMLGGKTWKLDRYIGGGTLTHKSELRLNCDGSYEMFADGKLITNNPMGRGDWEFDTVKSMLVLQGYYSEKAQKTRREQGWKNWKYWSFEMWHLDMISDTSFIAGTRQHGEVYIAE